jgi:hypothetical protein
VWNSGAVAVDERVLLAKPELVLTRILIIHTQIFIHINQSIVYNLARADDVWNSGAVAVDERVLLATPELVLMRQQLVYE